MYPTHIHVLPANPADRPATRCRPLAKSTRGLSAVTASDATPGDASDDSIIARSRTMQRIVDIAKTVAKVNATVLIRGESGVGKERIARLLHDRSTRPSGPFVPVNCAALPEHLLESELFGHLKGAFTGADANKRGLFEAAHGGTILLDEIGETSPATQVKLLRVLQEREIRPVGSVAAVPVDVRILAATNRDLSAMVEQGLFRKDLYYRLKVVELEIPPLRVRRDDILPLADEFARAAGLAYAGGPLALSPEAAEVLLAYSWPGNVRELQNAIESAAVLAEDSSTIGPADLPTELRGGGVPALPKRPGDVLTMEEMERRYILSVLAAFDGNRTHTARALGIGANTLWRKLKAWGVPAAR